MADALILGAEGAIGGYLARLLHARGTRVTAVVGSTESSVGALAALGIADDIALLPATAAPALAAGAGSTTIYAINDGSAARAALIAEVFAAAAPAARLTHVTDAALLRRAPAVRGQADAIAALRRDGGRHAVNAILHAHDSRLGPADALPARITRAAWAAAQPGADPGANPLDIAETGPRDWGWTPEYVDAVIRLAGLATPVDLAIGSGTALSVADFVAHAFAFFRRDPAPHVRILAGDGAIEAAVDVERLRAATGWSATTHGRDLVRALCEGAAGRGDPTVGADGGPAGGFVPVR